MTINIGLVTSDALILGCDSVASTSDYYLDPFKIGFERGPDNKPIVDGDGKFTVKFKFDALDRIVIDAWGGVTKMSQIHPSPSPMVAVTAGLAKLKDRPMASLASEFFAVQQKASRLVDCRAICDRFLKFMRKKYNEHYKDDELPPQLREGPEFLVGGFGRDDDFPSLYRVVVKQNQVHQHFAKGESGVAWNGQSDAVERFVRGFDSNIKTEVEKKLSDELKGHSEKMKEYVAATVNKILDKLGQKLPDGFTIDVPDSPSVQVEWERYKADIGYPNLPLQEGINLVAFLCNLQTGRGRFTRGVATVGGRTHIGVITKEEGFKLLNEPSLAHRYTGFGDDL